MCLCSLGSTSLAIVVAAHNRFLQPPPWLPARAVIMRSPTTPNHRAERGPPAELHITVDCTE